MAHSSSAHLVAVLHLLYEFAWANTGYYETFSAEPLAGSVALGLPGCRICTIGVEGTLGGPELDYIPMAPHYFTDQGVDLLVQTGTWKDRELAGQFLKYGSVSASDTDVKFGGSVQAFFGIMGGINGSEVVDAVDQGLGYIADTVSEWLYPSSNVQDSAVACEEK